jgi:Tol biopolymer transport system component
VKTIAGRSLAVVAAALAVAAGHAQQAPPSTEVFLADLGASGITAVRNISDSPGYDNQPHFLPDGAALLFSSNRDGQQTDIYRYDVAAGRLTQVTKTAESEYSPTPAPDGKTFTVIQVEADSTQRLWRFDLDGGNPRVVLDRVMPVGYHVWIDQSRLALFVLGAKGQPNTLQIADIRTGAAEVVESSIGRSLLRRPGTREISYVHKPQGRPWTIASLNPDTRQSTTLVPTLEGSEDLAWLPDGRAIMAQGTTFHVWTPGRADWQPLSADLPAGAGATTRIAVSPDGRRIAFVAADRRAP